MEELIEAYLRTIEEVENDIEQCQMQAMSARKLATQTTSWSGGMPGEGGRSDRVGNGVITYVSEERRIPYLYGNLRKLRKAMAALINTLEKPVERKVLNYTLISGESIPDTAEEVGYSRAQGYRIYKSAVSSLQEGPEAEKLRKLIKSHEKQKMRRDATK